MTVSGSSSLSAAPVLAVTGTAGPDPAALWDVYTTASAVAEKAWQALREIHLAGGTSSWSGRLYSEAYQAQFAAGIAYSAWLAAQAEAVPGARG